MGTFTGLMGEAAKAGRARHCHLCGRRLSKSSRVYTYEMGNGTQEVLVVCRQCHETAPRCDVCGVPMAERHVSLPDGRHICAYCHRTAVYDPAQAQELFERVSRFVCERLGLTLRIGADFTLADHRHVQRLVSESPMDFMDFVDDPERVVGLFIRRGQRRTLYVLSGLPRILFIQTVAHEWAHAWEGENCPLLRTPIVREGFAEWVAYKTLRALGADGKAALMTSQPGLYGDGLRRMLDLEKRGNVAGVLMFCRQAR